MIQAMLDNHLKTANPAKQQVLWDAQREKFFQFHRTRHPKDLPANQYVTGHILIKDKDLDIASTNSTQAVSPRREDRKVPSLS